MKAAAAGLLLLHVALALATARGAGHDQVKTCGWTGQDCGPAPIGLCCAETWSELPDADRRRRRRLGAPSGDPNVFQNIPWYLEMERANGTISEAEYTVSLLLYAALKEKRAADAATKDLYTETWP